MRILLAFTFCCFKLVNFSQIGPGSWQDHLSLNTCNTVAKLGSKIYASNKVGLVYFDELEKSIQKLNKINGLNDVGIKLLRTNTYNNKLLVIYENCNIDVIDLNGNIKNYPDFKLKMLNGKKTINEITFDKHLAYLACGFGIIIFDTEKLEIKDTYIIGSNAAELEVYQVALNDSIIVAATPIGLYKSNYKTKALNNYKNWALLNTNIPSGPYVGAVSIEGKILAAYSPYKLNQAIRGEDTLYILENNIWKKYPPTSNEVNTIHKIGIVNGKYFSLINQFGFLVRDFYTGGIINYVTSFNGAQCKIVDGYFGIDEETNRSYWLADELNGLYQTYSFWPYYPQNKITADGINKNLVNNIDIFEGKLAVSPSHPDDAGGTSYTDQGVNISENNQWTYLPPLDFDSNMVQDITYAHIDRKDKTTLWASSWRNGLLQYKNNKLVKIYNSSNSPMPQVIPNNPRCTGIANDKEGNLWFINSNVQNFLNVIKKNGDYQNFNFDAARFTRKIFIDKNNYIWALHERDGGITVYKNDNFNSPKFYDENYPNNYYNSRLLINQAGKGNLQSNAVFSIAEDNDGRIWVGTGSGISVFNNSSALFNNGNFDSQPIKIIQDGNVELLLGREAVTSIVVDGANNKWVGTQNGGLYCFSSDGLTQLNHFTKDNSPLYSNNIIDINYNEVTGDIFIGTEIGLQSYRSYSIKGSPEYSNVYAYPNPVRPNFSGSVYVTGLIDNSIVKIVDESGNMVWETKSKGGQIVWPVSNLSGIRVVSGVYIVYASSTDGEQIALTKILVIN